MKEYEFTALVKVDVTIPANSQEEARKEVEGFSCDGWLLNGEGIEVTDIDFVREVDNGSDM